MSANNYQVKPNVLAPPMPDDLYKEAIALFNIKSTLYNETSMSLYLCNILDNLNIQYLIDDYSNIIATKGKSKLYPCFSAHLDTVHVYKNGYKLFYQKEKDRTYLYAGDNDKKSVGIGGDDKCGIFVCLYLLKRIDNIKVIFFSQEESGGIGSSNINLDVFNDCKFLASVDRWNGHDFINQYSGQGTISKSFKKAIAPLLKKYDYSYNSGLFTDCFNVMERGLSLSCFNLSCGYYSHHSNNEYVDLNELYNACLLCEELAQLPDCYEHKYQINKFDVKKWDYPAWDDRKNKDGYKYQFDYQKPDDANYNFNDGVPVCEYCGLELLYYEHKYCSACAPYAIDKEFDEMGKDAFYN